METTLACPVLQEGAGLAFVGDLLFLGSDCDL
jgi:hypothetical protein